MFRKTNILEFKDAFSFLSNFYEAPIELGGYTFPSTEHAYQWAKFIPDSEESNTILSISKPGEAKKQARLFVKEERSLAYAVKVWDKSIKFAIMMKVVKAKFDQHPDLKELLVKTEDSYLSEGNWWHDNVWGNCLPRFGCKKNCGKTLGQNALGKVLMSIRHSYTRA